MIQVKPKQTWRVKKKNNKDTAVALRENMITLEGIEFTDNDSDEDLEDMKQFAKELSKELSQKVKTAAAINHSRTPDKSGICRNTMSSKNSPKGTIDLINCDSGSVNCDKETFNTGSEIPKPLLVDSDRSSSTKPSTSIESHTPVMEKFMKTEEKSPSSKHKKSKKHKKRKHKDAIFEGERVRGLVKSSTIEEKSKQELEEEASHNAKQDDYVLRKLFSKTGLKTAMQHEKIMESGHADYTLVEGEARRVAQEAVKAIKASRQQCWNPMSGQPSWTGSRGSIRAPDQRGSTQEGENRPHPSRPKFGKKKTPLKLGSKTSKESESGEGGSSALLARIRSRNLLLDEDNEEDTSSNPSVPQVVPDSNRELLDDIRTYVSFGASVEGRATTDEIVSQFRDRLPVQSSALFKQMLMQICEFHRLPSGQGVWKLIPEFNW